MSVRVPWYGLSPWWSRGNYFKDKEEERSHYSSPLSLHVPIPSPLPSIFITMALSPVLLLPIFLVFALFSPALATCRPLQERTENFCRNTPGVPDFSLTQYTGRWHQIYTAGFAGRFSSNRCVTANYTAQPDGSVAVLNCQYTPDQVRPSCVRGNATRRPGGLPSNLEVSFPGAPGGQYNVVATLGFKSYGYFAAAVSSCRVTEENVSSAFFIIARTPFKPQKVLRLLKRKIRCLGIPMDDPFVKSRNPPKCMYFDGPSGFDVRNPLDDGRRLPSEIS